MGTLYPTYRFGEQDPILELIRRATADVDLKELSRKSGVHLSTFNYWWGKRKRRTQSPRYATVAAVVRALGVIIRVGER